MEGLIFGILRYFIKRKVPLKKGFAHDWLLVKNRTSEIPDIEKNVIKPFKIRIAVF